MPTLPFSRDSLLRLRDTSWPDVAAAVAVLVLGWLELAFVLVHGDMTTGYTVLLLMTLAAGLARRLPSAALGVVWVLALLHLASSTPVGHVELVVVALVAFGTARWGERATTIAAGASIPAVALLAIGLFAVGAVTPVTSADSRLDLLRAGVFDDRGLFGALVLSLAALGLPFLAGLALRSQVNATQSRRAEVAAQEETAQAQTEAEQAGEIARLREEQARLSRDVHDVVGHSLAVILAQAESGQYLPDDPAQLKRTLATIATSARSSLQDVRHVLSAASAPTVRAGGLDALVAGVRATGQELLVEEVGAVRPLPPDLEVVAHRVLQEMLTNAVRHGVRDQPVRVERHWPAGGLERDLRIEVSNAVAPQPPATATGSLGETRPISVVPDADPPPGPTDEERVAEGRVAGQGLDGMRRRVEAVGGRVDVRRRAGTFTVTAWVPVSA